jgi:hypothetical protein
MAVQVNVCGLATIKVAVAAGAPLQTLGYTQNGAQITLEGYEVRVPGDENGGDDGPPIDIQILGQSARIRLEMTKFDTAVSDTILTRTPGGTLGTPDSVAVPIGTLIFASSQFFRLVIATATRPFNFPCVSFVKTPQELNAGTKFQRHIVEVEAFKHPTTGVLWNRTVV